MQQWHNKYKRINNMICTLRIVIMFNLEVIFSMPGVPVSYDHGEYKSQLRIKCNMTRIEEFAGVHWYWKMLFIHCQVDSEEKTSASCGKGNFQHVELCDFDIIW